VDVKLRVDIYPEDPRPWTELNILENPEEFNKIPCTVDVRERVDIYPEEPRPDTELTKEFVFTVVLIIP